MRKILIVLVLVVAGCASTPEPVAVPDYVTIHFLDRDAWAERTTHRTLDSSWHLPSEIRATSHWRRDDSGEIVECDIYFPAAEGPPSRELMAHEVRHCVEGDFH